MANAGCINAIGFDGTYLRTLDTLDSANIGVGVQYCIPAPLDDKRLDYIKYTDKCGCTCCITGENEILVYATQGVIKNFTLTNDDTNEVVKVKWNDLFGSNRAYTMVRYKTGSYPTSISDGTLAVKETTQNQYSVSGYNVSGLTDGTTYYFTAFAVSQDDTTIIVQSNSVTTQFGPPKDGLVALWKFEDDVLDYSGNGYNGSISGTLNYQTLGGKKCAVPSGNVNVSTSLTQNSLPITLCGWLYLSSQKNDWATPFGNTNRNNTSAYSFRMDINTFRINNGYSGQDRFVKTFELQQRYCVVMTIKQGETKVYVNGNLEATFNNGQQGSYMGPFHMFFGHGQYYFNQGGLRMLAVYNKILSDTEQLRYFNSTK